ncbi:MAG: hypothetical protein NTU57_02630 [Candidatus Aenigmarchaeota archaeon]|nr:hypothetical protein [Candidatus Aenigmarchaeota archaeon]
MTDKSVIDKDGEKKLRELEKQRAKEIEKLEKNYEKEKTKMLDDINDVKKTDKLKFWKDRRGSAIEDPKYWALVNVESLKEFIKYGANKVLDQIRVRTAANIMAREEIARAKNEKKGFDVKSLMFTLVIIGVCGFMAYILLTNFFNWKTASDETIRVKGELGDAQGTLAACKAELYHYNPSSLMAAAPPTSQPSDQGPPANPNSPVNPGGNTLKG